MKILIIHTYGLGDMIMFTPALQYLMNKYPNAKIDFLIFQKMAAEPIRNCKYIHNIYYSDNSAINISRTIIKLRGNRYDISIVTSGGKPLKASLFSFLAGAKERIGEYAKYPILFYTKNIKYQEKLHRVENNILLVEDNLNNISAPLFCSDNSLNPKKYKNETILIGIHPGSNAKFKTKRWQKEYFVKLINLINNKYDCKILLFAGPDELEESKYIASNSNVELVVNKSLQEVASLISDCNIFINTDSGLGHIASCYDIEIFTIFGPAKDYKIQPYSSKANAIKLNLECQPCYGTERIKSCKEFKCLSNLTPIQVFTEIKNRSKVLSHG